MKYQALFSLKNKKAEMSTTAVVISILRVDCSLASEKVPSNKSGLPVQRIRRPFQNDAAPSMEQDL